MGQLMLIGLAVLGLAVASSGCAASGASHKRQAAAPITIKFIGVLEQGNKKVAIFSDGKGQPVYAREGQTVVGQYKLLRIGVKSVTMSYLDGKGVQRIPMRVKAGQH